MGGARSTITQTDYGYKSEKDFNAGPKELRVLLSDPKHLATTYYQTLESDPKSMKFTDSMQSMMYGIELLESNPIGAIVYKFVWNMPNMINKSSRMEILIDPIDDLKTRITIKCTRIDLQFAEQLEASLHYLPQQTLDGFTSVCQELTTFHSMIEQAIQANLPYIRDAIIVKGDYIGTKVDIKDSVLQRTNLNIDGGPSSKVHVRQDGDYIPSKVEIKDSVVSHSGLGSGGETKVEDSVVVGKREPEKVDGAAKCLGDPNLETYRRSLERAMADGKIVETEERMLRTLRNSLGITIGQHDQLLEEIKLSTDKNYQTYKQMVLDAMEDGQIDPDEMGMLESLRQSLGISDYQHARAVEEARKQKGC